MSDPVPLRAAIGSIVRAAVGVTAVLVLSLLALGTRSSFLLALTGAALLGIFAFGSYQPLVERLYSPETKRFHRLPAWLLLLHTALLSAAALGLFRLVPAEAGALLLGLVVVPIAVAVEAFIQLLRPGKSHARPRRS